MPPARRPSSALPTTTPAVGTARRTEGERGAPAKPLSGPSAFAPPTYTLNAAGPGGIDKLLNTEWLLTNGLGGFAMGTCAGVPARRYHALLIGAANPPVGRIAALSAMVESVVVGANTPQELSTFRFCAHPPLLHPNGTSRLRSFTQDLTARWTYEVRDASGGVALEVVKELHLLDRVNAVQLRYTVRRLSGDQQLAAKVRLRPLTGLRDFHALIRRSWADRFSVVASSQGARVAFDGQPTQLHMLADRATFASDAQWWENFFYQSDSERGQDCVEDLFSPGVFTLELPAGEASAQCIIQASIAPLAMIDGQRDLLTRRERLAKMHAAALAGRSPALADNAAISALVGASDAFVVARRSPGTGQLDQTSIIAGYPWFADWGRDT